MELQRLATTGLHVVRGHLAPLAVLLLSGALLLSPQGVAAQDARDFNLQNASGATIIELYVSNQNASAWGSNILRGAVPPGGMAPVRFANPLTTGGFVPCVYDIRAVTGDRQAFETTMDLCSGDIVSFPAQFDRAASGGPPLGIAGIPQGQVGQNQPLFFLLQNTSPANIAGGEPVPQRFGGLERRIRRGDSAGTDGTYRLHLARLPVRHARPDQQWPVQRTAQPRSVHPGAHPLPIISSPSKEFC